MLLLQLLGELADLVGGGTGGGRAPLVRLGVQLHALRAAGLRIPVAIALLADELGDPAALDDRRGRPRVEVDHQHVGRLGGSPRADLPHRRVQLQRGQVRDVDEGRQLVDDHEVDLVAVLGRAGARQPRGAHPFRKPARHVLLEEERRVDAVRVALAGQRPAVQVGEQERRDAGVVVEHLPLAEARLGVEHLVEVGQHEPAAVDVDRHFRLLA